MNILKIVSLSLLVVSFASCKRDYADSPSKAPTNISASSGFTCGTLSTNLPDADFSLNLPFYFTATFSETVTWKIELKGHTSKATKTISGTSSFLDGTNAAWIGNHDGLYFFEQGELIKANLIISGKEGPCATISFNLAAGRDYTSATPTFMLVSNTSGNTSTFEGSSNYPYMFNIGATTLSKVQTADIRAPEGIKYMHIEGVSAEANGFFVGGLQCRKDAIAAGYFFPVTWTDPNQIYLNVYIRGIDNLPAGNYPYANLNFECHEDDNMNMSSMANCGYYANKPGPPVNNPDHFCPSSEDSWVFKVPIRHQGWQLFSCKYSDLLPSEDFANGGFGNRKLEPQKVCRVQFGVVSSPPFNRVSADIDFACFTYGAPYDPKK
ncbi:hypothetical protein [Cytophaga aurantiaca]|uniref:hypothetical protein n=1 Tax=Cytophaga aurantiaca TaxID=29530 RepID=UPI00036D7795|nr:hypothetical protein [Cytophaga aurantiaca]